MQTDLPDKRLPKSEGRSIRNAPANHAQISACLLKNG